MATTVMAVKATPKAMAVVQKAKEEKGEELTNFETFKAVAPIYIPTALVGVSTIACIFGANVLNKRQQAGLMSAYALLDNSYKDYKKKVVELYGKEGHEEVRNEVAKDRYKEVDIVVSKDKELFYDEFTNQYFESTIEDVQKAEYYVNREIQMSGEVALVDFYKLLDVDYDDGGFTGWSEGGNMARYWQSWVDFDHTKVELEDGLECTIITMRSEPYMELEI